MAFVDLKIDFVFRRIFATHPDILRGLVPDDLPQGPYREALELANEANFTQEERDAYQKVIDEIQQVRELAEAKWAEGRAEGEVDGFAKGKAAAVLAVLEARGIPVGNEAIAHIETCRDVATLDRWIARATTAASAEEVIAVTEEHA
jgi:hypothetical protein